MRKPSRFFIAFCLLFLGCGGNDTSAPSQITGCMDPAAINYNPDATLDDGSCIFENTDITGCTDPQATNYNPEATIDDGSCTYVHFQIAINNTGESQLVVFQTSITALEAGDEVGVFDASGRTNFNNCDDQSGEILVGAGVWNGEQLNIACIESVDTCPFGGIQLPGFINGHPIEIRKWDHTMNTEIPVSAVFSVGSGIFGEVMTVITELSPQ